MTARRDRLHLCSDRHETRKNRHMGFELQLSAIDLLIIAVSLVLAIAVGLWAGRNQDKTAKGYFLASKRLPWYIIGSAFVSTSVSSEQIVGTVGDGLRARDGHRQLGMVHGAALPRLHRVLRSACTCGTISPPSPIFSRGATALCAARIYSWLMLFAYVFIFMVVILYGGSLAFQRITGWNYHVVRFGLVTPGRDLRDQGRACRRSCGPMPCSA